MKKQLSLALSIGLLTTMAQADQKAGVGMESTVATGYGLYAVTMRVSDSPGAISSFYLYNQSGAFPSRWREIDLEFTPGFTGIGPVPDPNPHTHSLAQGQCYSNKSDDNLPAKETCTVGAFLDGKAGASLSFNTYNYRSIDGYPYAHSNDQVFMAASHGGDIFNNYYTYYIYYLPSGIYWTLDLSPVNLTPTPPSTLPEPSFVKKDSSVVEKNETWNPAQNSAFQAFWYDSLPLSPKQADGTLAESGALMKMSMNLWDGTNTDPQHIQDWGGETSPRVGANSSYKYVAYYPLVTPVKETVEKKPTELTYGSAEIYSDFTTTNGTFLVNNKPTTFETLWQVTNGTYLWPLGQLDERNFSCGKGQLTLNMSAPYPAPRNNYDKLTNCDWLNLN